MSKDDQQAYVQAFLLPNGPIEKQVHAATPTALRRISCVPLVASRLQLRGMVQKARSNVLYPTLKALLREAAPELVPFRPEDVAADKKVYVESKAALDDLDVRAKKWPRMCKLLCGVDEDRKALFYYTKLNNEENVPDEPHSFVVFVESLCKRFNIKVCTRN